jgi:osmoprotectant transport system substrate-binding protein
MRGITRIGVLSAIATLALGVSACSSGGDSAPDSLGDITVGAFNFTESQILAQLYSGVLTEAGYNASVLDSTNREVLQPALETGEVQVVPEYLGTFTEFLNRKVNGPEATPVASGDVDATYTEAKALAEPLGITVLTPSPAADQNAFAVTREFAEANNITSLSDLAAWSQLNPLILGGPPECPERPFCQPGLEGTYGIEVAEFSPLDAGGPLTKQALAQGSITLGLVFSSDGAVADLDLVVLDDDRKLQQVDNIIPAVLTSAVTPALTDALNALSAAMTTDDLIAMNKAVDIDRQTPANVARAFLVDKGLIAG